MVKAILSAIGIERFVWAGVIVGCLILHNCELSKLERQIVDLEHRKTLLTSRLEAANLREQAANNAIISQNSQIAWYEAEMLKAEQDYKSMLTSIRAEAAARKPEIITRWRDNPSCGNGLDLIGESQSRIWDNSPSLAKGWQAKPDGVVE